MTEAEIDPMTEAEIDPMTETGVKIETGAMTGTGVTTEADAMTEIEETSHRRGPLILSNRMAHARNVACTARRPSTSPSTAPMSLMWVQDDPSFFRNAYASTVPVLTKPNIAVAK